MKVSTVLVLVIVINTVTLTAATASCMLKAPKGCSQMAIDNYLETRLNTTVCVRNLCPAFYSNMTQPHRNDYLNAVCEQSCAGMFADWLQWECSNGVYNATSLYYYCLQPLDLGLGSYCAYASPAVFDADGLINNLSTVCGNGMPQQPCRQQCATQLQHFSDQLGCCYQHLYNNTKFVEGAVMFGELSESAKTALNYINNEAFWISCGVALQNGTHCDKTIAFPSKSERMLTQQLLQLLLCFALAYHLF